MGEGAGVLVMESLAHAKKRGATILGEYLGGGISTDAYDLTAPRADGRDVILCMRSALADAGLEADAVDLVNAHGTSTPVGDLCEVAAINAVLAPSTSRVPAQLDQVDARPLARGGGRARGGGVPAEHRDRARASHDQPRRSRGRRRLRRGGQRGAGFSKVALSNSFGFGGHNSSVLFGAFEG